MAKVEFRPWGKIVEVQPGTELIDAARHAGIVIDTPCGCKGTCGKCQVKILHGKIDSSVSDKDLLPGYIYACQSRIIDDVVIEVPKHDELAEDRYDDSAFINNIQDMIKKIEIDSLSKKIELKIPEAQMDDGISDYDRLLREIKAVIKNKEVIIPFPLIQGIPDIIRNDNGRVAAAIFQEDTKAFVTSLKNIKPNNRNYSIAVDVGTTTVSVLLADCESGTIIACRSGYNDQIPCGMDVISRINYAKNDERLSDLRTRILETINRIIKKIIEDFNIDSMDISSAVVSGNTVMHHLLLGIKPEYIRLEPYTPAILNIPTLSAEEVGFSINPFARIFFSPSVGSYVGGDITAGIICTDLVKDKDEVNLLIDIGTNGELVIGNKDYLITCACSAGPAFEGGGVDFGMRATDGAINKVTVEPGTGMAQFSTIGDVLPKGICGSGMIDLIAELFIHGWLDSSGKLARERESKYININGRRASYILAIDKKLNIPITISEIDIENIMRAKAAIYSACTLMLQHIGIQFSEIEHVYVAGGFGRYLNLHNAVIIGLLPDIPHEKFCYIGNSSLIGSAHILLSEKYKEVQKISSERMTYINLSNDPGYMDQYMAALFLPHTDFSKFPSVMKSFNKNN